LQYLSATNRRKMFLHFCFTLARTLHLPPPAPPHPTNRSAPKTAEITLETRAKLIDDARPDGLVLLTNHPPCQSVFGQYIFVPVRTIRVDGCEKEMASLRGETPKLVNYSAISLTLATPGNWSSELSIRLFRFTVCRTRSGPGFVA
jgi:hypothetical protein